MTVYLLHFARRCNTRATTSATDLDVRLAQHAAGQGARLLALAKDAGIGWELEGQLKKQLGVSRLCPQCGAGDREGRDAGVRESRRKGMA